MRLNNEYRLNEVAGEFMLVKTSGEVDLSSVFKLNESAAWLWERIGDNEFTEADLVQWLCGEFEVSREIAAEDVAGMVGLWRHYGMLAD